MRAIAVIAIVIFHVDKHYFHFGWTGVQFFFVLSGYLITGILIRMKESVPGKQYFYKFYGRRFLRIFPLYYFSLLIITIAIWQSDLIPMKLLRDELQNVVKPQLPYAYFYIYNFFYAGSAFRVTSFLTHFWSLSVEEQFYILWCPLLFFTPKEKVKILFTAMIALGPAFRLCTYFIYNANLLPHLLHNSYLAIYALPFSHIDAFAMGAYISQFQITNPRKQLVILVCIAPFLGFLTQYLAVGIVDFSSLGYELPLFSFYKFVWGYSLLNYVFALVIYNVKQTNLFINILEHFTLRYLGKISYGVYIYHAPIIWFISNSTLKQHRNSFPGFVLLCLIALGSSILVASVSFYLFEKPISDLKDRLFPISSTQVKAVIQG